MRRILALVLCLAILASTFAVVAATNEKQESTLLYSQSFNSLVTNTQPADMMVVGRGARVSDFGDLNKALMFNLKNSVQIAEAEVSLAGKFFVSFDIFATDKVSGGLVLKNSSGAGFTIVSFEDGKICTHNKRAVAGIGKKLTNIAIEADSGKSSYNLYINGKCVKSDYYVSNMTVKNAASVAIELSSENEATAYIDNVNVGLGKLMKSFPVSEYVADATEYEDTSYGVTDDVYLGLDFAEGKRILAAFQHKGNTLERYSDENGEEYCLFKRQTNADFHLDVNTGAYKSDSIVYQYDLRLTGRDVRLASQIKSTTSNYFKQFEVQNGVLIAGTAKVTLPIGEWQTISVVYNTLENIYDVYLNYSPIAKNLSVNYLYLHEEAMTWRIHINRTSGDDHFHVDNMVVYGGSEPRKNLVIPDKTELVIDPVLSALPGEGRQKSALKGKVSYHPASGVLYANDKKTIFKPAKNSTVELVPIELFEEAFGLETSYDATTGEARIGKINLKAGSNHMSGGAVSAPMEAPCTPEGNTLMVPLKSVVENGLGKKLYQDMTAEQTPGMIIMGDGEFTPPTIASELQELSDFTLYLRPDAETIKKDYEASPLKGVHPRYLADKSDFDRIRSLSKTDPTMIEWSKNIIAQADRYVRDATPLIYELRDGVRLWYVSMDMVEQMSVLAMAYQITGDKKYADRAWLDMESVSNFPDWHPEHHIDVGGLAVGLAIGYDWLYEALTPEQRQIIEKGVYQNGYIEYIDGYQGRSEHMKSGIVNKANHNMVMNAGATAMGIAFMDIYPTESAYCISEAIKCLEIAIATYAPEGAWYEGMNYAGMTLEYLSYQMGGLDNVFGTCYTLDNTQGVDKIVDYFLYMMSSMGAFVYADVANPNAKADPGILYIAEHYNDYASVATYHASMGISASPKAMIYYHPEHMNLFKTVSPDHLYESLNVMTTRDSWDMESQSVFAGLKGGRPADSHGHMDAGMFSFYANGTRWTTELSSEDYNVANYWSNATAESPRWSYYRMRAEAHSTVFINPGAEGEFDPQATAEIIRYESKPRGALGVLDMTSIQGGKASSHKRAMLMADDRQSLVLRDEISLISTGDVYWHMITSQIAEVSEDGKSVKLTDKNDPGNYVVVEFVSNQDFTLTQSPCEPLPTSPTPAGMASNTNNTTIRLAFKASGNLNITAKITPCTVENGASVEAFDTSIDSWQIPDGEIPARPKLDKLVINSSEYPSSKKMVTYNVSADETQIPVVYGESAIYDVNITQAADFTQQATIVVTDRANPNNKTTYRIHFNKIDSLPVPGLTERHMTRVEASEEPQPENPAVAVCDRNLDSRWSAEGSQYMVIDLGRVTDFDRVVMAFMNGNSRHYKLKMYVSADGTNYTEVFNGTSGGKSNDYEVFDIGLQNARYVKIEGNGFAGSNGGSSGLWNSWTEVAVAKAN